MRYTCFKTIVSKIFDGVLTDDEEIHNVLNLIREKELTCSMQVKSGPMHEIKPEPTRWSTLDASDV